MTAASIRHHTSETVIASHDGELLVADLHIIGGKIEVKLIVEKVEMCARLVVPARLRLIFNCLCDTFIISVVMCNVKIGAGSLGCLRGLCLEHIREHLEVITAGTVAL